jgi:hypothetical protein
VTTILEKLCLMQGDEWTRYDFFVARPADPFQRYRSDAGNVRLCTVLGVDTDYISLFLLCCVGKPVWNARLIETYQSRGLR